MKKFIFATLYFLTLSFNAFSAVNKQNELLKLTDKNANYTINANKISEDEKYKKFYDRSIDLYKTKNFQSVANIYELCGSLCNTDPFYFLNGLSQRQIGNTLKSIDYFEKIHDSKPAMNYEKAVSYFSIGDYYNAKKFSQMVINSNDKTLNPLILEQAKTIVELSNKYGKSVFGSLSIGVGHDTNPNYSPNVSSVKIMGFDINLDTPKSDGFKYYSADLFYKKKLTNLFGLIGSVGANIYDYNTYQSRDMLQYNIKNGIFVGNHKYNVSLSHLYSSLYMDNNNFVDNNKNFLVTNGASADFKYNINDKLSSTTSLSLTQRTFKTSPNRDGKMQGYNQTFDASLSKLTHLTFGGGYNISSAELASYGNKSALGYASLIRQISGLPLTLIGSYTFFQTKYNGDDITYNQSRKDNMSIYNAMIRYTIKFVNFNLSYSYYDSKSTISGYTFKRNTVMFATGVQF